MYQEPSTFKIGDLVLVPDPFASDETAKYLAIVYAIPYKGSMQAKLIQDIDDRGWTNIPFYWTPSCAIKVPATKAQIKMLKHLYGRT